MSPTPVLGSDGRMHLAYEMHLTNFYASNGPLRLNELSVFPQGSSTPLATYKGKELAEKSEASPRGDCGRNHASRRQPHGIFSLDHVA
jgi:hypothetical protein